VTIETTRSEDPAGSRSVAVVHLIRRGNPDRFLRRFLSSYATHPAGLPHDPVFLLKGFDEAEATRLQRRISKRVGHPSFIRIDDQGFDIGAYKYAAERLDHMFVVFLNSHSEILCDRWLARLISAFSSHPDAGIAGAAGNWETLDAGIPFPNVHLRSNAFAVRRLDFLALDFGPLDTKRACNKFEAGPRSMTHQMLERGLQPYVVGRDGSVFAKEGWPESGTFRSGRQENLLVADNRTRDFAEGSTRHRQKVARLSWGERSRPAPLGIVERAAVALRRLLTGRF
jgi:hypothetical protein